MEISESETDRQSLERFGLEAIALLRAGAFGALVERFGYAMAYGREPASAIAMDLNTTWPDALAARRDTAPYMQIKYFGVDAFESTGLVAVVECITCLADGSAVEFALAITGKDARRYVCLESVDRVS